MSNLEIYNKIFTEVLELGEEQLNEDCTVENVEKWDSISHITLISTIEDSFDIMLDTDDIIDFSSYEKGKEILKRYDIKI